MARLRDDSLNLSQQCSVDQKQFVRRGLQDVKATLVGHRRESELPAINRNRDVAVRVLPAQDLCEKSLEAVISKIAVRGSHAMSPLALGITFEDLPITAAFTLATSLRQSVSALTSSNCGEINPRYRRCPRPGLAGEKVATGPWEYQMPQAGGESCRECYWRKD